MFYKVLRTQIGFYKEDLVRLKGRNDDLIELCETFISLRKSCLSITEQQKKNSMRNIIKHLTNINYYLIELKKEIQFL